MNGPDILVRSLSRPNVGDSYGNKWQYHSRSDHHSKVACWGLLFDILNHCPLLRNHIAAGKVGFGINHEMSDFRTGRRKNLDLVLCTPGTGVAGASTFADLAKEYGVALDAAEAATLATFPALQQVAVGSVHLALEAKACMTAHIKALPRLYDELNSSHLAIHGSADFAIAAGFAVVNMAETFISPGRNSFNLAAPPPTMKVRANKHRQPDDAERTIEKLKEIPRRTQTGAEGFDALGVVVIEMKNDGSPVSLVSRPPAPMPGDPWHYDAMIHRISSLYATKFGNV
jgi:hypothetical protein